MCETKTKGYFFLIGYEVEILQINQIQLLLVTYSFNKIVKPFGNIALMVLFYNLTLSCPDWIT